MKGADLPEPVADKCETQDSLRPTPGTRWQRSDGDGGLGEERTQVTLPEPTGSDGAPAARPGRAVVESTGRRGRPLWERSRSRPNRWPRRRSRGTLPHRRSPWHFASLQTAHDAKIETIQRPCAARRGGAAAPGSLGATPPGATRGLAYRSGICEQVSGNGPCDLSCPTTSTVRRAGAAEAATLSCARRVSRTTANSGTCCADDGSALVARRIDA